MFPVLHLGVYTGNTDISSTHCKGCPSPLTRAIASPIKVACGNCFPISDKISQEMEKNKCLLTHLFLRVVAVLYLLRKIQ